MTKSQLPAPVPPVTYQLYVNGQLQNVWFMDVELRQCFGAHEVFLLRIEFPITFPNLSSVPVWPSGTPIKILWGRGVGNLNTFYGYINHHQIDSESDSGSQVYQLKYTCIGTSRMMNSENTRQWGNTTPTYMAKQIAFEHGLRAVLSQTNWVSDNETQTAESDFDFLNRMAAKYGFRFYVSGGTLYFIDPSTVLAASSSQGIPMFVLNKTVSSQDTVRKFTKIEGDNVPGAVQATRVISGVDQNSGTPFSVVASGTRGRPITKIQTAYTATSVAEGQVMADAWQAQNQFYSQATAELFGNSLVYPGKLIGISGNALPAGAAGFWMVSEAKHVLKNAGTNVTTQDRFVTRVTLLRNTGGAQPTLKGLNVVNPEFIACTITSNGLWQAANLTPLYYGTA
jgi:hypothetical protein